MNPVTLSNLKIIYTYLEGIDDMNTLSAPAGQVSCGGEDRPLGVMEQLVLKKSRLTDQIAEIDETIALFEKNQGVEECLTHLSKVGIYR